MFYFIRHGDTDYSEINTKIYQGFGVHLSPLSQVGIRQIEETSMDPRLKGADLILSSPYTRALQTAAILSKALGAEIRVETDLHEWLADKNYRYLEDAEADQAFAEYEKTRGSYPGNTDLCWEDARSIRARVMPVLEKYRHYEKVIVATHGMMIQAVAGGDHPRNGEIVAYGEGVTETAIGGLT